MAYRAQSRTYVNSAARRDAKCISAIVRVVIFLPLLLLLLPIAYAQTDTLERVEHFPGTTSVRARYSVLAASPSMRHGAYAAYHINGLPNSVGRYDEGVREGPWLLYDSQGRARFREHFTDGERVERVALRVLPVRALRTIGIEILDTTVYSGADILLANLAWNVRYPAMARERNLSGSASVQVLCGDSGGGLFPGRASHPIFAKAVAELLPTLTGSLSNTGLMDLLCRQKTSEVVLQFRLE